MRREIFFSVRPSHTTKRDLKAVFLFFNLDTEIMNQFLSKILALNGFKRSWCVTVMLVSYVTVLQFFYLLDQFRTFFFPHMNFHHGRFQSRLLSQCLWSTSTKANEPAAIENKQEC